MGGACCTFYRGETVVDLWGGVRNKATGEPWERDTMVVVHSATNGLAAMTLAGTPSTQLSGLVLISGWRQNGSCQAQDLDRLLGTAPQDHG